jgi:nitrite reductase (NADH) large subunit
VVPSASDPGEVDARTFTGFDLSTNLKLMGVDVASSAARSQPTTAPRRSRTDPVRTGSTSGSWSIAGTTVTGGVLVGGATAAPLLAQMACGDMPTPAARAADLPRRWRRTASVVRALSPTASVCSCNNVTKAAICRAITAEDSPMSQA